MISGVEAGCLMRTQYLANPVITVLNQKAAHICGLVLPLVQHQALGSPLLCRKRADEIWSAGSVDRSDQRAFYD